MMNRLDMHAHICSYDSMETAAAELEYRGNAGIYTYFSTGNPDEYCFMARLLERSAKYRSCSEITFGIHPWYSDRWNPGDWTEYYRNCRLIGEIGMDDLWCDIPLPRQQHVLEEQLAIAADMKKPVVLHTKACEAVIAKIVKDYPYTVLVHWYSGDQRSLFDLIDQGCFFTLGPDTGLSVTTGAENMLLKNVPQDRLLPETDGLEAILWSCKNAGKILPEPPGPDPDFSLIPQALEGSAECAARYYLLSKDAVWKQLSSNLSRFLSR